jgi:hypothetical protein
MVTEISWNSMWIHGTIEPAVPLDWTIQVELFMIKYQH